MCTVTYIPRDHGQYWLTTNRDEQASRSPQQLTKEKRGETTLIFPRDLTAGGTWIVTSDADRTVCLLNGAFEGHEHRPPYRRSRGLMVLDFFDFPAVEHFLADYSFDGIEPFTMVIVEGDELCELRWDERKTYFRSLPADDCHIWSSATLYGAAVRQRREHWFRRWRRERNPRQLEAILDFHHTAGEGDPWNDVVMNRNGVVQTVSISTVGRGDGIVELRYEDLLRQRIQWEKISVQRELVESR